jgi:hypothetical protein
MNNSNPLPRRYFGLTSRELALVAVVGVLFCAGLAAIGVVTGQLGSAVVSVLEATAEPTREPTRAPTLIPTATFAPTTMPTALPTPTAIPLPGLSRQNPLPPGTVFQIDGWEMRVIELRRGKEAAADIAAANRFNPTPPPGREYVTIRLRVKDVQTGQQSAELGSGDFRLVGDRLIEYASSGLVPPAPALDVELFPGGEADGWLALEISEGEDHLQLIFDRLGANDVRTYVALIPEAALAVPPDLVELHPTDLGRTREQPAPVGQTAVTGDWAVSVLEAVRGEAAWQQIHAANRYNEPPAEGFEYILVRARVRYLCSADQPARLTGGFFKTIGSSNVVRDAPSVVEPKPPLDAALFTGGSFEGWIVVQTARAETGVLLIFQPFFDFDDAQRRYLQLPLTP